MKTPITDRTKQPARNFPLEVNTVHAGIAEKLESDRAALMEALEKIASTPWVENALDPQLAAKIAESALSAASANFPD